MWKSAVSVTADFDLSHGRNGHPRLSKSEDYQFLLLFCIPSLTTASKHCNC